jgi:tetratricopeptide (TPR) repeat protein
MGKIIGFVLLWRLLGNPILALLVLFVILYLLDRRFIGIMPSFVKPFKRSRKLSRLRQELSASPHNTSGKLEAARLLIERKKYKEALDYLEQVRPIMDDSPEVIYETGFCKLKLGDIAEGERLVLQSLGMNPRLKYGEPYLRLGETFALTDPDKAIGYLVQFRTVHSSSCEAYYRLGKLYTQLGRGAEAKDAFRETVQIYRGLPKYKRRSERKWALLAKLQRG